jgi:hypothetical protein
MTGTSISVSYAYTTGLTYTLSGVKSNGFARVSGCLNAVCGFCAIG